MGKDTGCDPITQNVEAAPGDGWLFHEIALFLQLVSP
jgi:hypothetical protein